MRKFLVFLVASVDGYLAGPNGEFDWPVVDEEFNEFAIEQLDSADTMIFGRATYDVMVAFWPTEQARTDDPLVAERMNKKEKVVVSRTMDRADWEHTRLVSDVAAIAELKRGDGGDVIVMGSSELTTSLLAEGLIDELRIMVMPIALGGGRSVLNTLTGRVPMTLLAARSFASGNVLLSYRPGAVQS